MAQREEEYKRLELFYQLLVHYLDRPYSDVEVGDLLGTSRGNVWRIRKIIKTLEIPLEESLEQAGKYSIRKDFQMRYIHFSPAEMASLYLAARRLQQQTKTSQEHVSLALKKLANAMHKPFAESLIKAAGTVKEQEQDNQQEQVFSDLVTGWLDKTPVRIFHHVLHGARRDYVVHPYHIEPSPWGDGNYLIGYSEHHKKIARFKIARIEKVVQAPGAYREPDEFDVQTFLKHAWGIWSTDEAPVTVRLRFNKWALPRLTESNWPQAMLHPPAEDGSCVWEVQVAEWREMFSWVKGWGSNVTILEPGDMVEEMKREVRRWVRKYEIVELPKPPLYQLLWAKTSSNKQYTHPLICHLIDVGQATLALWNDVFANGIRSQIATALYLPVEDAGRLIAFWAALHDLGKASPAFQRKHEPAIEPLTTAGLSFPKLIAHDPCYHATITTRTLPDQLVEVTGIARRIAEKVAQALGGHHGVWPTEKEVMDGLKEVQVGSGAWDTVRRELVQALVEVYQPPVVSEFPTDPTASNALLTLFSGITSVADWIGSMESYFPYEEAPINIANYANTALQQAKEALRELGWCAWQPPTEALNFVQLFGVNPRPMQEKVIELEARLQQPSLVIIEAPTGTGKTEAALYLADQWGKKLSQRGLYVAMPTMATSNQMHGRVKQVLQDRYPDQLIEPLLVHSQARWQREAPPPDLAITDERPHKDASVVDMSWFLPTKRSLLAPFAVGTVDQTLLSVLLTRHFFVRLFALSHKTVIFDEVHAYDTYMSALFQRLLGWLHAMGTSVVLLSATLPAKSRKALLGAWLGNEELALPAGDYPAIWWASGDQIGVEPLPTPENRHIHLSQINRSPEEIVVTLQALLQEGGCAAVICNTVARTQEVYKALEKANLDGLRQEDLILFHARSPFGWRAETEKAVLARFDKNGNRPHKAIVVATQVIEQSLDLDFDVMISDLAPIDLLIQRAGRLHRHEDRVRPATLREPQLFIAIAQKPDDMPDLESDVYIYEPLILYRSYLALQNKAELVLPKETSPLIELVYGEKQEWAAPISAEMSTALAKAEEVMRKHNEKADHAANLRLVLPPTYKQLLYKRNDQLEEEDASIHKSLQALTRLGPPTVALVCLHEMPIGLNTEPDGSGETINEKERPDAETTQSLARCTVSVSHQGVVQFLLKHGKLPTGWHDHSLLRNNHFLLRFQNGVCRLMESAYILKLTKAYGLEISKEEQ